MKKLTEVFSTDDPTSLLFKVFFDLMLYLCRRGQENLADMKLSDFTIAMNGDGRKTIIKHQDELTKNRRESTDAEEKGVIVETGNIQFF